MKKSVILLTLFVLAVFPVLSAAACDLSVSLLNQDPYPAMPGEYVKVVFQIDGIENPDCGTVTFGVKEDYPISLDPEVENPITIESGTFQRDYSSFYLAPFKLRVDENAIEGDNPIEVSLQNQFAPEILTTLEIYVEDMRADFEVHIKNYDYTTRALTFEILNIGESDIKALTVEIPKQNGIQVKGANTKVIGDLDSNEYTTADFETVLPENEVELTINIAYTDSINVRRDLTEKVQFDPSYFTDRTNGSSKSTWWIYVIVILVIAWFVWRRIKKNNAKKKLMQKHH